MQTGDHVLDQSSEFPYVLGAGDCCQKLFSRHFPHDGRATIRMRRSAIEVVSSNSRISWKNCGQFWQERIVQYASDNGADLIVMPSQGLHGLKRLLLGSTTERVLRHADISVLVLRGSAHESVE